MQWLEIAASLFTLICVLLAVKRSLWQFPFGLVGTALFFFVFRDSQLYASAALQVFFFAVQGYGWWYWLGGSRGGVRPPIRRAGVIETLAACGAALIVAAAAAAALEHFTDAQMALPDAAIFGLSVVGQILLDRKRVENWPVWVVVNALSVWVYGGQGLWAPAALYVVFFFNAFWGWVEWRTEMKRQGRDADAPAGL